MKKIVSLIFATCLSFSGFSQVVDQSQLNNSSSLDFFTGDISEFVYQSFTAGISGELTSVDLAFSSFAAEDLTIEIYKGAFEDANLGGTPLGSGTISLGGSFGVEIVSANFTGIQLKAGDKYSIKINGGSDANGQLTQGTSSNLYAGGLHTDLFGTTVNSGDLYFVTHMIEQEPLPMVLDLCNTSLSEPNIQALVNSVSGASQYRFKFFDDESKLYSIENRSNPHINFSTVDGPKLLPGKTYSLDVIALGESIDSLLVEGCSVTTYTPGETSLKEGWCGKVLTNNVDPIVADEVAGAEKYRFTFKEEGVTVVEKTQVSPSYEFNNYKSLFKPGTEYTVTVQVYAKGVMGLSSDVCTIRTYGPDPGVVLNCGDTFSSWNNVIKAQAQNGAQKYQFIFNNGSGNITYTSSRDYVKLRNVSGLVGNSTYSIKVRVLKGGVFSAAAESPCSIGTPSGAPSREGDAFVLGEEEVFMYPNPSEGTVVYFTGTIHNVEVVDALGSVVMFQETANELNISDLDSGMYIVKSDEGFVKLVVK